MPVTLDVALGFKYGSKAEFQHFGKELQNAVQRFDKMPLTLCHGTSTLAHHLLTLFPACRSGFAKYFKALCKK